MNKNRRKQATIPPGRMPADPVKAVWWFMHWLLQIFVRFFWLAILLMTAYEVYANLVVSGLLGALVEGVITVLIGFIVWGGLYALLLFMDISTGVKQTMSDIKRFQEQSFLHSNPYAPFMDAMGADRHTEQRQNVVEGTITDLEEERNKRRRD